MNNQKFIKACLKNDEELTSSLLNGGVNPNQYDEYGNPILISTYQIKAKKTFYLLLEQPNIDISLIDKTFNQSLLFYLDLNEDIKILEKLIHHPTYKKSQIDIYGNNWLMHQMKFKDSLIDNSYIEKEFLNIINDNGENILILASQNNDQKIETIIEKGVNIEHADNLGNNFFHYLAKNNSSLFSYYAKKYYHLLAVNNGKEKTPIDLFISRS